MNIMLWVINICVSGNWEIHLTCHGTGVLEVDDDRVVLFAWYLCHILSSNILICLFVFEYKTEHTIQLFKITPNLKGVLHQILRETSLFCQHDTLLIQDYDNRTTRLHSYIWRNSRLEKKHRLFDFHTDKTTSMEHKLRNYH